ncbi:MAG: 2-C-methyl-D-erythritol 2,4-cyclodiphosphate synthase, partial [Chlorobi bacterium CHB2]|nr:2-C-methyl-D-erythritol 2,4-cyclodiphosphate synthase [Chlorobi bacterium CHB2]
SGANSVELLAAVVALLRGQQLRPNNVDCMVLLERPKIAPFREQMRETIAATLGISIQRVSVKATTHEGLGPIGAGEGVAAYAVATVVAATADQPNAQP